MKNLWKSFARIGSGYLRSAGEEYKLQDANNTGRDDLIGVSLTYAADLLDAILGNKEIPKAPAELR